MFFEQVAQNATTWSKIIEGPTNFSMECDETKPNVLKTNSQL
jgi:hypothetical protein